MTTPATQFKLGLFVLIGLAAAALAAVGLGLHTRTPSVRYHSYFDESVSGLEIGSPVDFRGVRIGFVGSIAIAPDLEHIDVGLDVAKAEADMLRLEDLAPTLRARLETQGITGVKYVDIQPRNVDEHPLPELEFAPDLHYIPARHSLLFALERQLDRVGKQVPVLVDHATATVDKLGRVFDDFHDQQMAKRIADVIDHTDATVMDLRRLVRRVDRADLPEKTGAAIADLDAAVQKAREVLAKLSGIDALIASARRSADAIGDFGRSASGGGELEQTIRDLGDAARAFRDLVQEVERDPDMLVKGRARSKKP
jgi:phospholipid/cholesterol/gamma-HCH transport system substrate-binding protein